MSAIVCQSDLFYHHSHKCQLFTHYDISLYNREPLNLRITFMVPNHMELQDPVDFPIAPPSGQTWYFCCTTTSKSLNITIMLLFVLSNTFALCSMPLGHVSKAIDLV